MLLVVEPRATDMHITYRAGLRHPLNVAASGIAILAGSAPLPGEREAVTQARGRGWAQSAGELLRGTTGVGAPIRTGEGPCQAAISAVWLNAARHRRPPASPRCRPRAGSRPPWARSAHA